MKKNLFRLSFVAGTIGVGYIMVALFMAQSFSPAAPMVLGMGFILFLVAMASYVVAMEIED